MLQYPTISLKPKREQSVKFHHPWIFSGAIGKLPEGLENGSLVQVADINGNLLGVGTYSKHSSIAVRIFDFKSAEINTDWFQKHLKEAEEKRQLLGYGLGTDTTGYRVVFGESDGIPGLIVDRYENVIVFQIATAGMDLLRPQLIEAVNNVFEPRAIVERSDIGIRTEEKLKERTEIVKGEIPCAVFFLENGLRFEADVIGGQKTGFFFDQKDLRLKIKSLAKNRTVLNLFSYTGATSSYALGGGAKSVHNVDSSESALSLCEKERSTNEKADVFEFLGRPQPQSYDMVILDPPALIKNKNDVEEGKKAYHFINRAALRLVNDGGIFVTSSCSHFLSSEDFIFMLRRASLQAGVELSILHAVYQSPDHPISVYFPESLYLKSFVCDT